MWLNYYYPSKENTFSKQYKKFRNFIIYGILITQCIAGVIAFTMDIIRPFSSGKEIALFLKEKDLLQHKIVTESCEGTVLSSDLRKEIYFLCSNAPESFCKWGTVTACNFSKKDITNKLAKISLEKPVVFISKTQLLDSPIKNVWYPIDETISIKLLTKTDKMVTRNTDYTIYEIRKTNNEY